MAKKFLPSLCEPWATQCNAARQTHPTSMFAGVHFPATTFCIIGTLFAAYLKELPWVSSSLWRTWIPQVASSSGKRTTRHPGCWFSVAWVWSAKEVALLPSPVSWPRLMTPLPHCCLSHSQGMSHSKRQCSEHCPHWSATPAFGSCRSLPPAVQRPGNCSGRTIWPEGASFDSKGA